MLTVRKIDSSTEFEKLRAPWSALLEASAADSFFHTWEWLYTWWKRLAGSRELFLLAVLADGDLVGLAPLAARPRRLGGFSGRTLEFLGAGAAGADYLDVILHRGFEDEAIAKLAQYLGERKLLLELGQLGESAAAWRLGRALRNDRGYRAFRMKTEVCPYIDLTGHTWNSYLAALGPSHRANFARRLKQLAKAFDVRFESVRQEGRRAEALAALIELHHHRWRGRGASEAFSSGAMTAFHGELSRLALERDWLRLFLLRLNDRPAAGLYGFYRNRRFYFFQSGLDPEYSRYSVGLVTMGLAIKSALEEGAEEYDLLHGNEAYKFLWARRERGIYKLELYPPGIAGLVQGQISHAGRVVRNLGRTILPQAMTDKISTARRMALLKGYYATPSR